jgi:hypothetical protein
MTKCVCFIIGLLFMSACFSQTTVAGCEKFKTGKLAYRDSSGTICEIKRTNKIQTDYNPKTKLKIRYKIEWTSDCEYKLTQTWASSKKQRKLNNSWLSYRIESITDNTYDYSCTCNDSRKVAGKVMKREY